MNLDTVLSIISILSLILIIITIVIYSLKQFDYFENDQDISLDMPKEAGFLDDPINWILSVFKFVDWNELIKTKRKAWCISQTDPQGHVGIYNAETDTCKINKIISPELLEKCKAVNIPELECSDEELKRVQDECTKTGMIPCNKQLLNIKSVKSDIIGTSSSIGSIIPYQCRTLYQGLVSTSNTFSTQQVKDKWSLTFDIRLASKTSAILMTKSTNNLSIILGLYTNVSGTYDHKIRVINNIQSGQVNRVINHALGLGQWYNITIQADGSKLDYLVDGINRGTNMNNIKPLNLDGPLMVNKGPTYELRNIIWCS